MVEIIQEGKYPTEPDKNINSDGPRTKEVVQKTYPVNSILPQKVHVELLRGDIIQAVGKLGQVNVPFDGGGNSDVPEQSGSGYN